MPIDPVTAVALGLNTLGGFLGGGTDRKLKKSQLEGQNILNRTNLFKLGVNADLVKRIRALLQQGSIFSPGQRIGLSNRNLEASKPFLDQIRAQQIRKTGGRSPFTYGQIARTAIPMQAQFENNLTNLDMNQMQQLRQLLAGIGG